jgi:hypothetical protein
MWVEPASLVFCAKSSGLSNQHYWSFKPKEEVDRTNTIGLSNQHYWSFKPKEEVDRTNTIGLSNQKQR